MSVLQKSALARALTLACLFLLLLLMIAESLLLAPANTPLAAYAVVIALKTLPLLCFLPGLLRRRSMAGVWLALMLLPYFCLAVLSAFAPGTAGLFGLAESLLIAFCFFSALLFTRWQRAAEVTP
ncbi:MAG: DUF2069 domain-containing protein [Pedobacter sp.]|nr:DUF2069 domain-containing protein [Pedobacter sp.]